MNIQIESIDNIKIYVYKNINIEEDIRSAIKKIINKLKDYLELKGYYKVYVYYRKIGLFLNLIRVEDSLCKEGLDLSLILDDNNLVYYKTTNYSLIKKLNNIKYLDGYFYCIIDDYFDKILEKVEFGEFVFGYGSNKLLKNSLLI